MVEMDEGIDGMWEHAKQPQLPQRRPTLASLRGNADRAAEPLPPEETMPARASISRAPQPLFGPNAWFLGLASALPALISAVILMACAGAIPRLPRLPVGPALAVLLIILGGGAVIAYVTNFPAWTHPGLALIPLLALFLPANTLFGQVVVQINGESDPIVFAPVAIVWLLLLASCAVTVLVAFGVSHRAPAFSGIPLLPLPLFIAWRLVLLPAYRETLLLLAISSALALTAFATFIAWIAPQRVRPYLPLAAIALQLGIFWLRRFHWPALSGIARLSLLLDLVVFAGLIGLIASAPVWATWVRRDAWPVLRRVLGIERE